MTGALWLPWDSKVALWLLGMAVATLGSAWGMWRLSADTELARLPRRRPAIPMPPTPEEVADRLIAALAGGHPEDGYVEPGLRLVVTWQGPVLAWDLQVDGVSHLHFTLPALRAAIVREVTDTRARRAARSTPERLERDCRAGGAR